MPTNSTPLPAEPTAEQLPHTTFEFAKRWLNENGAPNPSDDLVLIVANFARAYAASRAPIPAPLDVEAIAAKVHESWMDTKRAMGFHGPNDICTSFGLMDGMASDCMEKFLRCDKFHADIIPYQELPEEKKELDRTTVRTVLKAMRAPIPVLPSEVSREMGFKPVYQTKFGLGEGDCLNAAVASILSCELQDIPDFAAAGDSGWFERLYEWGKSQGIGVMCLTPPIPDNVLVPDGYCIFIHEVVGVSEENHAVVGEIRRVPSEVTAWEWEAVQVHDPARGRHKLGKLEHIILLIPRAALAARTRDEGPTISDLQDYFGEQFDKALMHHGFDRTGDCSVGAMAEELALIVTDKLEEIRK